MFTEADDETDGPRVMVTLPDEQQLLATVRRRRHVPGPGPRWWYLLELPLWAAGRGPDGRVRADLGPVQFWAPADVCEPLPGEDYGDVRTDHARARTPAFLIEETPTADTDDVEHLVVHRGDCAAPAGMVYPAAPATARRAAAAGAARCEICAPPAP
ncbi:DUF6233 domain-containing protein [Streptomyces xiamenensis]|uniref:DUF6233 domain-containing protein n=1 Tax=Streptomyces xiamenensis TaxID=408015 RepID=UPI0035E34AF7